MIAARHPLLSVGPSSLVGPSLGRLLPGSCAQRRTPRFLATAHYQPPSIIDPHPSLFHTLTNPFSRKPFISTSIQNHGVCALLWLPTQAGSDLRALCVALFPRLSFHLFSTTCTLFSLLALFPQPLVFVFNHLPPLLPKHRGVGTRTQLSLQVGNLRTLPGDRRGHASLRKGSPAPSTLAFRVSHFDFPSHFSRFRLCYDAQS